MSYPTPIRLRPADADRYRRVRLRMLQDAPWAFDASPDDDLALNGERLVRMLAEEHHAIFAIEAPAPPAGSAAEDASEAEPRELAAVAAIMRPRRSKFMHRSRIWGVFVEPAYRGRGYARAVLAAALETARTWRGVDFVDLGVSANSTEALRLYESLGFVQWGREPEATEHEGRRYDEIHMTLRL